jgi:hypothetical protein
VLLFLAAGALWVATGREGYTRWPDEKLAASDAPAPAGEDDLLAEIGFDTPEDGTAPPDIESRFALGLAPGGFDIRHLPSVALAGALAAAISITAATSARLCRRRAAVGSPSDS